MQRLDLLHALHELLVGFSSDLPSETNRLEHLVLDLLNRLHHSFGEQLSFFFSQVLWFNLAFLDVKLIELLISIYESLQLFRFNLVFEVNFVRLPWENFVEDEVLFWEKLINPIFDELSSDPVFLGLDGTI